MNRTQKRSQESIYIRQARANEKASFGHPTTPRFGTKAKRGGSH